MESWKTKRQSAYRLAAVLGMLGFLLGMTRMLYAQQQSLAVQNMLQEQEVLSGQEQQTVIQGKITKKERKNNQTRLYLNHEIGRAHV